MQNTIVSARYEEMRKRKGPHKFRFFSRPETSWLDHTLYDMSMPEEEFKKHFRLCRDTFWHWLILARFI